MPSVTFLKQQFQAQVAPGDDEEFLRILQEADTRLQEACRHRWTRTRIVLTPTDGIVVLPAQYASILGVQIGRYPAEIRAEEYEFVVDGMGDIPLGSGGSRLIDQGLNETFQRHYKVTGGLGADTELTALVLYAPVMLYDPDIPDSNVPDEATDTTRCPSTAALKLACIGVVFEEAHDMNAGATYFQRAFTLLDENEQNQRGNARQSLNIRPLGTGIRGIRNFR